jgi:hypothetical protein
VQSAANAQAKYAARTHQTASALSGFQNSEAFFHVTDALIEIADGCAHHHQHAGAFATLLPDQVFDPSESRGLRDYAVLNFDQDLQYDVGRSFSHDENIT